MLADLRDTPLRIEDALDHVRHPGAGGIDLFLGVVRDHNLGQDVVWLEYQAYRELALTELAQIGCEVEREFAATVAVIHRVGTLAVGDLAVVCAASAAHRAEAFAACRALIDRVKTRVPIWKREHGPTGARWLAGCEPHP